MVEQDSILMKCQACGRQDETLRFATYPYVVSVIFATFQRQFSGLWCRWHRMQYWLQAGLITAIIGWIGIPFGFFFTSYRLFQLMKGGIQPAGLNAELLRELGKREMEKGNVVSAIECYEASLQYADSTEVRELLKRAYQLSPQEYQEKEIGWLKRAGIFLMILIGFGVLGTFAGFIDYWLAQFIGQFNPDVNLFISILTWTPLVTMIFLCIALLRCFVEWSVRYGKVTSFLYPFSLGAASLLLLVNGISTGEMFADLTLYIVSGEGFATTVDLVSSLIYVTFLGGVEYFMFAVTAGQLWGYIIVALLAVSFVAGLVILWQKSHDWSKWQHVLAEVRGVH
jgi:hypothetical protein